MGYIKEIKIGSGTANLIEPILYGTTNTAAGTQIKDVSISNFELVTGVTIAVKFTVTNTHATPQLNINSTGAKSIKYRGGNLPSAATLTANRVYQFVYDGTNWELIGDLDTNTQTITGVKGNAETNYRTGQVNLTAANIGLGSVDNTADADKTVKYANMLTGFTSRASNFTWGNQTGTAITVMNDSTGGSIGFRRDNPASGQMSMSIDGTIYIKEGGQNIAEAVKSFSVSDQTVTYTTLWGNTGTFTTQDTKNTAGSTNSTSKLYLIGATSQAANPTTNSYQYTYTNNGLLSALKLGLNLNGTEKAHLEWNDTDQSIDFIFA